MYKRQVRYRRLADSKKNPQAQVLTRKNKTSQLVYFAQSVPCLLYTSPESADRPKWSALDNRVLRCTVGNEVRDWKAALALSLIHI